MAVTLLAVCHSDPIVTVPQTCLFFKYCKWYIQHHLPNCFDQDQTTRPNKEQMWWSADRQKKVKGGGEYVPLWQLPPLDHNPSLNTCWAIKVLAIDHIYPSRYLHRSYTSYLYFPRVGIWSKIQILENWYVRTEDNEELVQWQLWCESVLGWTSVKNFKLARYWAIDRTGPLYRL